MGLNVVDASVSQLAYTEHSSVKECLFFSLNLLYEIISNDISDNGYKSVNRETILISVCQFVTSVVLKPLIYTLKMNFISSLYSVIRIYIVV